MMDKGEMVRNGYRVIPATNGGWTVHKESSGSGLSLNTCAFTNTNDLLEFLVSEHAAADDRIVNTKDMKDEQS